MTLSNGSAEDLKRLTVPQLKALCKEKKITAYSKLGKNAIIQKILDYNDRFLPLKDAATSVISSPIPQHFTETTGAPLTVTQTSDQTTSRPHLAASSTVASCTEVPLYHSQAPASSAPLAVMPNAHFMLAPNALDAPLPSQPRKRKVDQPASASTLSKKKKKSPAVGGSVLALSVTTTPLPSKVHNRPTTFTVSSSQALAVSPPVQNDCETTWNPDEPAVFLSNSSTSLPITEALKVASKSSSHNTIAGRAVVVDSSNPVPIPAPRRFVPLTIKKLVTVATPNRAPPRAIPEFSTNSSENGLLTLHYLDFATHTKVPRLRPVSFPPSLSQRKSVARLALVLSAVLVQDLPNVALTSRLFRYAVYISAVHRLSRSFPGDRLTRLMQQYSPSMTNLWPYLRQREEERLIRQNIYRESFLGRALEGKACVSDRLWTSPDNPKQATIAVRFLLARLFFMVSTGHGNFEAKMTITNTEEVVEGEIWTVEFYSAGHTEILYVLEATCEVVGHPAPLSDFESKRSENQSITQLRADWSAYVNQHVSLPSQRPRPPTLMKHLQWTNHEEYDRGISKIWLSRIHNEGDMGAMKRVVAERYVLACVVGNSVSGRWMSSTEMAQEYNGLPAQALHSKPTVNVHLFLPAHHHVESLHFTSTNGRPLHPALAVVQTPAREYYIFKDNGMQVGCEEEGVAAVWMELLKCNSLGGLL